MKQRGATPKPTGFIYNLHAWRNHCISELERQRTRSSMAGRSYK